MRHYRLYGTGRRARLLLAAALLGSAAAGGWGFGGAAAAPAAVSKAAAPAQQAPGSLQELIDQAAPGSSVLVPAGRYQGPVVLNKPLKLQAAGDTVIGNPDTDDPVLTIAADGAEVSGLVVTDSRDDPDSVAVQLSGSGNTLAGLSIRTMGYGVRLHQAHGNRLSELAIEGLTEQGEPAGAQETEPSERGNGIDLLESDNNVITGNRIANMFDGIYVEKSSGNRIEGNTVTLSRYGYHLMFSKNTVIRGNTGIRNITGAMIMSDEGARVSENDFAKQSENATAQGILLFDVKGASVENNRVEGNRLGLYAQGITGSTIRENRFLRNFTGIQMMGASDNKIEGNEFVANVAQAQAEAGQNNRIALNYWDSHAGLDLQGDGVSDLAYRSNPFFLALTDETPAYQLFFGSPGIELLEGLFGGTDDEAFTDRAPLMHPQMGADGGADGAAGTSAGLMAVCLGLLAAGIGLFWVGGRTK